MSNEINSAQRLDFSGIDDGAARLASAVASSTPMRELKNGACD